MVGANARGPNSCFGSDTRGAFETADVADGATGLFAGKEGAAVKTLGRLVSSEPLAMAHHRLNPRDGCVGEALMPKEYLLLSRREIRVSGGKDVCVDLSRVR